MHVCQKYRFTSDSGWNYCWFSGFDQKTSINRNWLQTCRWVYDVRCWNGRTNQRGAVVVRGEKWRYVRVWREIAACSNDRWFWFNGSNNWCTDHGACNIFARTNIIEIVVRWRLHRGTVFVAWFRINDDRRQCHRRCCNQFTECGSDQSKNNLKEKRQTHTHTPMKI